MTVTFDPTKYSSTPVGGEGQEKTSTSTAENKSTYEEGSNPAQSLSELGTKNGISDSAGETEVEQILDGLESQEQASSSGSSQYAATAASSDSGVGTYGSLSDLSYPKPFKTLEEIAEITNKPKSEWTKADCAFLLNNYNNYMDLLKKKRDNYESALNNLDAVPDGDNPAQYLQDKIAVMELLDYIEGVIQTGETIIAELVDVSGMTPYEAYEYINGTTSTENMLSSIQTSDGKTINNLGNPTEIFQKPEYFIGNGFEVVEDPQYGGKQDLVVSMNPAKAADIINQNSNNASNTINAMEWVWIKVEKDSNGNPVLPLKTIDITQTADGKYDYSNYGPYEQYQPAEFELTSDGYRQKIDNLEDYVAVHVAEMKVETDQNGDVIVRYLDANEIQLYALRITKTDAPEGNDAWYVEKGKIAANRFNLRIEQGLRETPVVLDLSEYESGAVNALSYDDMVVTIDRLVEIGVLKKGECKPVKQEDGTYILTNMPSQDVGDQKEQRRAKTINEILSRFGFSDKGGGSPSLNPLGSDDAGFGAFVDFRNMAGGYVKCSDDNFVVLMGHTNNDYANPLNTSIVEAGGGWNIATFGSDKNYAVGNTYGQSVKEGGGFLAAFDNDQGDQNFAWATGFSYNCIYSNGDTTVNTEIINNVSPVIPFDVLYGSGEQVMTLYDEKGNDITELAADVDGDTLPDVSTDELASEEYDYHWDYYDVKNGDMHVSELQDPDLLGKFDDEMSISNEGAADAWFSNDLAELEDHIRGINIQTGEVLDDLAWNHPVESAIIQASHEQNDAFFAEFAKQNPDLWNNMWDFPDFEAIADGADPASEFSEEDAEGETIMNEIDITGDY